MKTKWIVLLVAVLLPGIANAQTCTPVTISYPNAASSDDGHGNQDNWQFGPYWWSFVPTGVHAESVTVTAGPYFFDDAITGVVNMRNGFGGCQLTSWVMDVVHQYVLTDTGTGVFWKYQPRGQEYDCSIKPPALSACAFNAQWDPYTPGSQQRTDLVSGHHYRLDSITYATVFNVGSSPDYTYSIYITVE